MWGGRGRTNSSEERRVWGREGEEALMPSCPPAPAPDPDPDPDPDIAPDPDPDPEGWSRWRTLDHVTPFPW